MKSLRCIQKDHDLCDRHVITEIEPQVINIEPLTGKMTVVNEEAHNIYYYCDCQCHNSR